MYQDKVKDDISMINSRQGWLNLWLKVKKISCH